MILLFYIIILIDFCVWVNFLFIKEEENQFEKCAGKQNAKF